MLDSMQFELVKSRTNLKRKSVAVLHVDNWDDYHFVTAFTLVYFDADGDEHDIGWMKIGRTGMVPPAKVQLSNTFEQLGPEYFSLGQRVEYYEELNTLKPEVRDDILDSLNDLAKDLDRFDLVKDEEVVRASLLRTTSPATVKDQFHRVATGGEDRVRFKFRYTPPTEGPNELDFEAVPESVPPSNIHVLIGKNGVGKTRLLNNMSRAFLEESLDSGFGTFLVSHDLDSPRDFTGVVAVAFSAFDSFKPFEKSAGSRGEAYYVRVGLKAGNQDRREEDSDERRPAVAELHDQFGRSIAAIAHMGFVDTWRRAVSLVSSDALLRDMLMTLDLDDLKNRDADIENLKVEDTELYKAASDLFGELSSGHKIVSLTIARLIESVRERTLVLIDEPETHLHPPLLSAFVRSISELMSERNGVAIIATHSPVVVQEIPRSCVWKLQRSGGASTAERPDIETFGENVSVLTRDVFGLEVYRSGFHALISKFIDKGNSFETIRGKFRNQLGSEALFITRALEVSRDRDR